MNELYWISILGNISCVCGIGCILLIFLLCVAIIAYIVEISSEYKCNDTIKKQQSFIKKLISILVILLLPSIFIPSTNQLMIIYGVGGTIDYIQDNPNAKQLPDKCIKILTHYI